MQAKVVMRSPATCVPIDAPLWRVEATMARGEAPDVLVLDGKRLVGFVHERDVRRIGPSTLADAARYEYRPAAERLRAADALTRPPEIIGIEAGVAQLVERLTGAETDVLAVVDGGEVVGTVSRRQLLDLVIREADPPAGLVVLACVGSVGVEQTVEIAARLADRHDGRLHLLHVLPALPRVAIAPETLDRVRAQRALHVCEWLSSLVRAADRRPDVLAAEGAVEREAARAARRLEADVVVADRRVAPELPALAPCPVLFVGTDRRHGR
jgi:CBS domain-containing protein